jgi:hypothetical protein
MAMLREQGESPAFADGRPCNYTYLFETNAYYINYDRRRAEKRHAHVFEEHGLISHVMCWQCGLVKLRAEVPAYNRKATFGDS